MWRVRALLLRKDLPHREHENFLHFTRTNRGSLRPTRATPASVPLATPLDRARGADATVCVASMRSGGADDPSGFALPTLAPAEEWKASPGCRAAVILLSSTVPGASVRPPICCAAAAAAAANAPLESSVPRGSPLTGEGADALVPNAPGTPSGVRPPRSHGTSCCAWLGGIEGAALFATACAGDAPAARCERHASGRA